VIDFTKHYLIKSIQSNDYARVCLSLDYCRPETYLNKIWEEATSQGLFGRLLIDLRASNGVASNRFFEIIVSEDVPRWSRAKKIDVDALDKKTIKICNDFYKTNSKNVAFIDAPDQ